MRDWTSFVSFAILRDTTLLSKERESLTSGEYAMTIIRPSKVRWTPPPPEDSKSPYLETVVALPVGAAPLIAALCRDIGLPQIIDAEATWDRKRCILSPGERITALVVNLLCEERRPLYKVANSFEKRDTELLFGKGITPEHLNDDCLGRGLDTLWEIDPSRIFRLVSSAVRVKECLETVRRAKARQKLFDATTRCVVNLPFPRESPNRTCEGGNSLVRSSGDNVPAPHGDRQTARNGGGLRASRGPRARRTDMANTCKLSEGSLSTTGERCSGSTNACTKTVWSRFSL